MAERATTLTDRLERYIDVLLRVGSNLRPGQTLLLCNAPTEPESITFVHQIIERAYAMDAGNVVVQWKDRALQRQAALHASEDALRAGPVWEGREMLDLLRSGAAYLRLVESDPELFAGVESERMATLEHGRITALRDATLLRMGHAVPWTIAGAVTSAWARLVFPDKNERQAVNALWKVILHVARADVADPVAAWQKHLRALNERADYLNTMRFRRLHYRAPGTDLRLDLPEGHLWISAGHHASNGERYVANIPTEEVYSMPQRDGVNGTVRSTLPLVLGGQQVIEHIELTFKDGRIVKYAAAGGQEALAHVIETDEGSHHLGEVALVPVTSPCNVGFPLFNTLYDENASCHLAIGQSYRNCLEDNEGLSGEELATRGANASAQHVDFMIGSAELDIDGETTSGERIPVFRKGIWAEHVPAKRRTTTSTKLATPAR